MPSLAAKTRRLNFCEWTDAENPWIDSERWRSCEASLDRESLRSGPCCGGLDLSGTTDLTALALVFPHGDQCSALSFFWMPAEGLREREDRDRVPYSVWRDQGHLIATPGRSIDYAYVALQVKRAMDDFGLRELAFDRYRIPDFIRTLSDLGVTSEILDLGKEPTGAADLILRPHGQGYVSMMPAVDLLEGDILNGRLRVDANPVMTMCSSNAVLVSDPAGNRKFDKRISRGRIDGIVALAMARRCASTVNGQDGDYIGELLVV